MLLTKHIVVLLDKHSYLFPSFYFRVERSYSTTLSLECNVVLHKDLDAIRYWSLHDNCYLNQFVGHCDKWVFCSDDSKKNITRLYELFVTENIYLFNIISSLLEWSLWQCHQSMTHLFLPRMTEVFVCGISNQAFAQYVFSSLRFTTE